MTRVETGSRLHFGLLRPAPAPGGRAFGGCGLMVEAPPGPADWHGARERAAFAALPGAAADDGLCRLVLLGLLPALADGDLDGFGEALFEYNGRAGVPFRAAQGGTYCGPATAALVAW